MKLCLINRERKHLILVYLFYLVLYFVSFISLEQRSTAVKMVVSQYDHLIPFCEYFIIPYLLWFLYLIFSVVYFLFVCERICETKKFLYSFMAGMSIFLLISLIFPNGHNLRPILTGDNFFISCVKLLYAVDTSTNVFPSMHVFCTIAATIALMRQSVFRKEKGVVLALNLITVLIVLSTVFLKQHSIIDAAGAILLNFICYGLFYKFEMQTVKKKLKTIINHMSTV